MTQSENERLAKVETELVNLRDDVGEIKTLVGQMTAMLQAQAQRGNDRHANMEARIAVLEDRSARLEKLLWASGLTAAGSVAAHIPNALSLVN